MRVARVDHAHRPARHQQPGVEHELRPAPVPRALGDRQVACEARLLEPDVAGRELVVVRLDQRLADVVVRRRPDLAVSVHLRALRAGAALVAGEVVADVRVVERACVHAVVADARDLVAGDVRTDGERVLVGNRDERLRVEELGRGLIRPALAHRAGLIPRQTGVRPGDHAVRDHVRVLVCDHGHVVVAVDAWSVEARRNRLPEEHVRHRHEAVVRCELVRVVARREHGRPADDAAGLSVSVLRVVPQPTAAEVVHLRVEGRLREAEVVRPVVHAVVHRVQVCARRIDVVQLQRRERGRVTAALVTTGSSTGTRSRGWPKTSG